MEPRDLPQDDPDEAVRIDDQNLNGQFLELPALYARWGYKHAEARRQSKIEKTLYDRVRAQARLTVREKYKGGQGGEKQDRVKGPTTDDVDAMVEVDEEVQEARLNMIAAEARADALWVTVKALEYKKDALMSAGADRRKEMEHDPTIRAQVARESFREGGEF